MSPLECVKVLCRTDPRGVDRFEQAHAALVHNYGHFTSMQVRDGAVPGLGLHLQRLVASSQDLFASSIDPDRVRFLLRRVIADTGAAVSARINVFSADSVAQQD